MNIVESLILIGDKLKKDLPDLKWAVVGSMATAIQGCNIIPGDIDIWIERDIDVEKLVNCFQELLPEDSVITTMEENWVSSLKKPTITFQIDKTHWTFGRVYLNEIKIDIAHAVPYEINSYVSGTGIWENGPDIKGLIKFIPLNGTLIPVVPLEVQLQTNYSREIEHRISEITKKFRTEGYDESLLHYCLNQEYYKKFSDNNKIF
jgi:hypothetical protein